MNFIGDICFEAMGSSDRSERWFAHIPGLPGLWGSGATQKEARADLLSAMPGWAQISRGDFSGFTLESE